MGIAIFAPSYNLVHGCALESIRRQVVHWLSGSPTRSSRYSATQPAVVVLDQPFWAKPRWADTVVARLHRERIHGIIILVRYGDRPMQMRKQIDLIIRSLFSTPRERVPIMPICLLFHGNEVVAGREKRRIKTMFKAFLTHQAAIPREMFTNHLIQVRHTYSKCLRDDKIGSIVEWMEKRAKTGNVWQHYIGRVCRPEPAQAGCFSRGSFLTRQRARRSLSEPRVVPGGVSEYLGVTCGAARRTVNLSADASFLKAALRQVADGDRHWDYDCWTYERAVYLYTILWNLITHRDQIYADLKKRIHGLRVEKVFKPRKRDVFLTHISWSTQTWSQTVTHVMMRCEIGGIGTEHIVRLTEPLSAEELRIVRAFILDHYSGLDRRGRRRNVGDELEGLNLHRSLSVHEARGSGDTGSFACLPVHASEYPFRENHSLQTVFSQATSLLRLPDESASSLSQTMGGSSSSWPWVKTPYVD